MTMTDQELAPLVADAVQMSALPADAAVLDLILATPGATGADRTRTAVAAALQVLASNDVIRFYPRAEWPEWLEL